MTNGSCWVAGDTKLETPEGALTVRTLAAKPAPVLTREAGRVRFRALKDAQLVESAQPVLRLTLDGGASFRVGMQQVLILADGSHRRADALQPGDALAAAFVYPEGYAYASDTTGETIVSDASLHVVRVEPDGEADLYRFSVNVSGCFFVAAGVLCCADGA